MDVDYSPTGREFVAGSYDRSVRIYGFNAGHSREVSSSNLGCSMLWYAVVCCSHLLTKMAMRCTQQALCVSAAHQPCRGATM
jgi:hypothetical protein